MFLFYAGALPRNHRSDPTASVLAAANERA